MVQQGQTVNQWSGGGCDLLWGLRRMKEEDGKNRSGWDLNVFQESGVLTCQRECVSADCSVATTLTFNVDSELYSSQCNAYCYL